MAFNGFIKPQSLDQSHEFMNQLICALSRSISFFLKALVGKRVYSRMEKNLQLKKYVHEDWIAYHKLVSDDQTMQYITNNGRGLNEEQAEAKFKSILEINRQHPLTGYFQVCDLGSQQILGECKLVTPQENLGVFEIGYLVKPKFWRQGIGSAMCAHLLGLAGDLNPNMDVIGVIHPSNEASKLLLQKFGFRSYFTGAENGVPTEKMILRHGW